MFGFVRFYLIKEYVKLDKKIKKSHKFLVKTLKNAIKYYKKD